MVQEAVGRGTNARDSTRIRTDFGREATVTILILARSQVPHAWRTALALFALVVWLLLAVYWLMNGPEMWLLRLGWWGTYPGPVSA